MGALGEDLVISYFTVYISIICDAIYNYLCFCVLLIKGLN